MFRALKACKPSSQACVTRELRAGLKSNKDKQRGVAGFELEFGRALV